MNLRPNHPVGQALGRLAEQVRAVPADGATVPNVQVTGVAVEVKFEVVVLDVGETVAHGAFAGFDGM